MALCAHHSASEREDPPLGARDLSDERAHHVAEERGRGGEQLGERGAPDAHAGVHEHGEVAELARHLLHDARHREAHSGAHARREARADRQPVHLHSQSQHALHTQVNFAVIDYD